MGQRKPIRAIQFGPGAIGLATARLAKRRTALRLVGDPPLPVVIDGGVQADPATAAILVNTIPQVLRAGPGLHSVLDLGVPRILP